MKRIASLAALFALIITLSGCGSTPTAKWASGRSALTTAQNVILQQHAAGNVTDAELVEIDPAMQGARGALMAAEAQLPEGGKTFESQMAIVDAVLERVAQALQPG